METNWECVVVGGGAAGLAAALVLGRARRRTLVLDAGGQSNLPAEHVGGLLGHPEISPAELYARGRAQIAEHPTVEVRDVAAADARIDGDGFLVELADGEEVRSRTLILATGLAYELPDVPAFRELWGGQIFHCPFCHGWEVRDRPLVVYGGGEKAEMQERLLQGWSSDVTRVEPSDFDALRVEDGELRGVVLRDGTELPCGGLLVGTDLKRRERLAESLGLELNDHGTIQVDAHGHTSVPGVFAAGDVAVAPQQVAIAIGTGHTAGAMAAHELILGRPVAAGH